jgi:hypothetical protein
MRVDAFASEHDYAFNKDLSIFFSLGYSATMVGSESNESWEAFKDRDLQMSIDDSRMVDA